MGTISKIHEMLTTKQCSCTELTKSYLEEIEKYGNDIRNAVAYALEFMFDEIPEFIPLHTFES